MYFFCNFFVPNKRALRVCPTQLISLLHPAAVTNSCSRASIQTDMRLQKEKQLRLQHAARLNRLVFGVALLWLVTSVLLLVISGLGSARSDHNDHQNDRTRKDAHQHLFARIEHQATPRASFIS
jgi:hypothetical protein